MSIVHKLQVPDSSGNAVTHTLGTIHYVVGTGTTAGTWTGTDNSITEYYDGLTVAYKLNIAGASTTTLNINGLGARTVYRGGTTKLSTQYGVNSIVLLVYTTTSSTGCWQVADYDSNTTYTNMSLGNGYGTTSTASGTATKTVSLSSYALNTGGIVSVKFTNAHTASSMSLNINSKGAKTARFMGSAIGSGLIKAGDTATFIYDGTYYHLISIDSVHNLITGGSGTKSTIMGADYSGVSIQATAQASHAEGGGTQSKSDGAHAEGVLTVAGRIAEADTTDATKLSIIATAANELGMPFTSAAEQTAAVTKLSGFGAHGEGFNTQALGTAAHSEGNATKALANATHAEGDTTEATGEAAHSEGYNTRAIGNQSHSEGLNTAARGNASHTEGRHTNVYAEAAGGHAEGIGTGVSVDGGHAEGVDTLTSTLSSDMGQHVQGRYNDQTDSQGKAFVIGGGVEGKGKNIHTVDWYGNAVYVGTVETAGIIAKDADTDIEIGYGWQAGNIKIQSDHKSVSISRCGGDDYINVGTYAGEGGITIYSLDGVEISAPATQLNTTNGFYIQDSSGGSFTIDYAMGNEWKTTSTPIRIQSGNNGLLVNDGYYGDPATVELFYFGDDGNTRIALSDNKVEIDGQTNINGTLSTRVLSLPASSGSSTFGFGKSNQIIKSNGTDVYWADNVLDKSITIAGSSYNGSSALNVTKPTLLNYYLDGISVDDGYWNIPMSDNDYTTNFTFYGESINLIHTDMYTEETGSFFNFSVPYTDYWKLHLGSPNEHLDYPYKETHVTVAANNLQVDVLGTNVDGVGQTLTPAIVVYDNHNGGYNNEEDGTDGYYGSPVVEVFGELRYNGDAVATISAHNTTCAVGTSSKKLYLVGSDRQGYSAQTNTRSTAYISADGHLYSNSSKVLSEAYGPETSINWSNSGNRIGNLGPIATALSTEFSANRLAFMKAAAIAVESSDNAGSTWAAPSPARTDGDKIMHVTKLASFYLGNSTSVSTNQRFRMTLTAQDGTTQYLYTRPRKLLIHASTNGHQMAVKVEYRKGNQAANEWTTYGTFQLNGWSAWNEINIGGMETFGGSTTQVNNVWQIRLTYSVTSVNSSYASSRASVLGVRLIGETCWAQTSNMGYDGHLYSFDSEQNATFPAKVYATALYDGGHRVSTTAHSHTISGTTTGSDSNTLAVDATVSYGALILSSVEVAANDHSHNFGGGTSTPTSDHY